MSAVRRSKDQTRKVRETEPVSVAEPQEQQPAEPVEKPVKVSVVLVSYNRAELLHRALSSLERSEGRDTIELVAVDNASTDGSTELEPEFPDVRFIRLPRNFGLTKALNIGIRATKGEYLLLLHDDTEVFPDTIAQLAGVLDREADAAAVCPLLVSPEGEPVPQLGSLPSPGAAADEWAPAQAGGSEPIVIQCAHGAAIMVRSYFLRAIRQIDERYGVYGSGAEVCAQVRRAGKKILLAPSARVIHHAAERELRASDRGLLAADRDIGRAAFLGKHYGLFQGISARIGATFSALGGSFAFRDASAQFSRLKFLLTGQKIDGTQR
jgi:GT2 family glycosyltransferase